MDASLQAQYPDPVAPGVLGQMLEQRLGEAQTSKRRAHVHPPDLPHLRAEQLDAATAGGRAIIANDEERDRVGNQFLHAETMTALARIERRQMRVELCNQRGGVRTRRMLRGYDHRHSVSALFLRVEVRRPGRCVRMWDDDGRS